MANEKNLKRYGKEKTALSREEAAKTGKKGGEKSGEARREKRALRETLQTLLSSDYDVDGKMCNGVEAVSVSLIKQALKGNVKAYEIIRDTLGEKPAMSVNIDTSEETRAAYEKAAAAIKDTSK